MFLTTFVLAAGWYASVAFGQTCENFGTSSGSGCTCPPGYGGTNCSVAACGGNIFQSSQRPLVQPAGEFTNITGCSCQSGWGGEGCNVCRSSDACQTAFNAFNNTSPAQPTSIPTSGSQNNSLTCNTGSRVWAAGHMSCDVINPTLQALFPLTSNLNIIRTLNTSFTPVAGSTSFGSDGSLYAQLIYNGVEQFYCQATSCGQSLSGQSSDWKCNDLSCVCRPGADYCGKNITTDISGTINQLSGALEVSCGQTAADECFFKQTVLVNFFGPNGLSLNGCSYGECVRQAVIDEGAGLANVTTTPDSGGRGSKSLSGGVIAGLAVVGALVLAAALLLTFGFILQRKARKTPYKSSRNIHGAVGIAWNNVSYYLPYNSYFASKAKKARHPPATILQDISGRLVPGQFLAILGPSGAGKTTLVECLSGKAKSGQVAGSINYFFEGAEDSYASSEKQVKVGYVDQLDVLPTQLTPLEALVFAAKLRLPESMPHSAKLARVYDVLTQLGLNECQDTRIGSPDRRGISGGEMRRVSIGLELVGDCDVLVLDEPTSGLDSVSALRVVQMLKNIAHDPDNPRVVICSIHQPSSKIYQSFDQILLLSRGRSIYSGPGGAAPAQHFASKGTPCPEGYNVADHLLDLASQSEEEVSRFVDSSGTRSLEPEKVSKEDASGRESGGSGRAAAMPVTLVGDSEKGAPSLPRTDQRRKGLFSKSNGVSQQIQHTYAATFLTQLEVLSSREWKILRRDRTLFITHTAVAAVLGVFCGGLYFKTDDTIAGFQSRVGCLFFLGALIAFSSLSALYNLVEIRALFLRERAGAMYSPTAWLISRLIFDVIPLRLIPTIIVSTITYWMAGLAHDAPHFFKFLFILVLYSLAMTLFNFLLACVFRNGGVAILLSALTALYQMTYAGFFVHLNDIPPVLRWLQWLCPLKYTLEALSVNEVGAGLLIQDVLEGVPVNVSAVLILNLLFGFGVNNYYRDVLVLFAFIAGFGIGTIAVVWLSVRERR